MYKAIHPLKILFYISFCFLIFISLFPGSIFGFLIYGDIKKTPYIINYSIESTFSHLLIYLYISILGFFIYYKEFYIKNIFLFFISTSIFLEVIQILIPHRSFQLFDLILNVLGVFFGFFIIKFFVKLR